MEKLLLLGGCYYDTEAKKYISEHIGWDIYGIPGRLRNYNRRILLDLSCCHLHWRTNVLNWILRDTIRLEKGGLRVWRLGLETIKASTFSFIFFRVVNMASNEGTPYYFKGGDLYDRSND